MKRFSFMILSFIILGLIGCGEDLRFKEGSVLDTLKGFFQNVQEGKKDKATHYIMKSLREDAVIKNFIANKIDSFEIGKEIFAIGEAADFKARLEAIQKPYDAKKFEEILKTKAQPELARLLKEKSYIVKITENGTPKTYIVTYFSAQNLNNITGIFLLTNAELEKDLDNIGDTLTNLIFNNI